MNPPHLPTVNPILPLLSVLLLSPAVVVAQPQTPDPDSAAIRRLARRLESKEVARVEMVSLARAELFAPRVVDGAMAFSWGRLLSARGGERLEFPEQLPVDFPQPLPLDRVRKVEVLGHEPLKNILIGGAIGLGTGLVTGLIATRSCGSTGGALCGWDTGEVLRFGLISMGVYAVLGAGMSLLVKDWKTVYRAR